MRASSPLVVLVVLALAGCDEPTAPVAAEPPASVAAPVAEPVAGPDDPDWIEVDAESVAARLRARPEPFLLVNVWSTWCEPCVEEMPELLRVARGYEDRGLGVVLISTDPAANRDAAAAFLRERGAPMPSWLKRGSDDAFIRALHPAWSGALPATLLLDRQRRVHRFFQEPVSEASLREPIESLLARGEDP